MANNRIQVKRTSVSGRLPNTTNVANSSYIAAGELAINLTDGILYSSNGSSIIPIGANNVNINVSGNLTVKSVVANGSIGTTGQYLTSDGTKAYWSSSSPDGVLEVNTGIGLIGGPITGNGTISVNPNTGIVANSSGLFVNAAYIATISPGINTAAQYTWTNTQTFSNTVNLTAVSANGSLGSASQVLTSNGTGVYWSTPSAGAGGSGATFQFVTNQFTGNGSVNTYSLSQSTTTNNALVFINGVEQVPNSAYTVSGSTLTFTSNISNGSIVEVRIPTFSTYSGSIADFQTYVYTASNNQTTFTGVDNNSKTLTYTAGYVTVFLNGVKLVDTVDFTANNGTSVILASGAANNDVLEVVSQAVLTLNLNAANTFLVGNTYLYSSNNLTTTSATLQTLDTFFANTYRSASYFVQVTDNTNGRYHAQNITLIHDGANVSISEFGAIYTANSLATFDATISSGIVYLQVNPVTANSTIRVARTAMVV